MSVYRQALIEEIHFWRELIEESEAQGPSAEYQRMRYALQLAEKKLLHYELVEARSDSGALSH